MNRRTAGIVVAALLLLAAVLFLLARDTDETPTRITTPGGDETPLEVIDIDADVELRPVDLYFPDSYGLLTPEPRELQAWSTPVEGARALLEAVLGGPTDPTLSAPLPPEASLGPVHLTEGGVLYVDLVSQLPRPPSTGSQVERLSIWSLVDTVALGLPEVNSVVLLWNSRQLPNFGGHVDTSLPLPADRDLIRTRR